MFNDNITSTFKQKRVSDITKGEASGSSSNNGVCRTSKTPKINDINDVIIEDIGIHGYEGNGFYKADFKVKDEDVDLKCTSLTDGYSDNYNLTNGGERKVLNGKINLNVGESEDKDQVPPLNQEYNNHLSADNQLAGQKDSENPVQITVSRTHSNETQNSFSGSTFGKKVTKKIISKPHNPHLLSPDKMVFKIPVEKKHSHSASDLKDENFREEIDTNGNLYMGVDDYQTFFGVDDPPVGEWESVGLRKKASNCSDYNVETLEALKKVTRKFDSFRMRMLRAKSFYSGENEAGKAGMKQNMMNMNRTIGNGGKSEEEEEDEKTILEVLRSPHTSEKCHDFNRVSYAASQLLKRSSQMRVSSESVVRAGGEVGEEEVERITLFYSSIDCEVYSADCLVDVLVSVKNNQTEDHFTNVYRWVQVWVGVPVLILNKGNHPRKPRQLLVALAEKETGLPLWKERITYSSDYREIEDCSSHLLNESGSDKRALKMRWSIKESAKKFYAKFKAITCDQNDPLWKVIWDEKNESKTKGAKRHSTKPPIAPFNASYMKSMSSSQGDSVVNTNFRKLSSRLSGRHFESSKKRKSFKKEDISVPCDLREITRVHTRDRSFRMTFAGLLPVQNKMAVTKRTSFFNKDDNSKPEFRPRLPTN